MTIKLYGHPFSSYTQKALIAFHENGTAFEFMMLSPEHPDIYADFAQRWPIKRFPLLVDGERQVMEATCIIEYLHAHDPGKSRLIPDDADAAIEVRMLDRLFDNYIHAQVQRIVGDSLRQNPAERDPYGVNETRARLDTAYAWLDQRMANREWAACDSFSLADCAAAPALFYADWTHRIDAQFRNVHAYRQRLLARPSFARCVEGGRPYRHLFPLGAPDRD
ncbi:MAG TPA: glutathione S-transferase family protein [Rhodanobacteraceae bacterium]|nr:glutathione S-transferase family protein [Rhodanobacteraceae bacterium]